MDKNHNNQQIQGISVVTRQIGDRIYRTRAKATYPLPLAVLWARAGSPNALAPHCLDLKRFVTAKAVSQGNKIEELHVFAGIPQKYVGNIVHHQPSVSWGMYTYPTTLRWLFGLPHAVEYRFAEGSIQAQARYTLEGVFGLPLIRSIVLRRMEKAIGVLLASAEGGAKNN